MSRRGCPGCQGPIRETTNMICLVCLTSYAPEWWPHWVIAGDELMKMLYRVQRGDSPSVVYMEAYANSRHDEN